MAMYATRAADMAVPLCGGDDGTTADVGITVGVTEVESVCGDDVGAMIDVGNPVGVTEVEAISGNDV